MFSAKDEGAVGVEDLAGVDPGLVLHPGMGRLALTGVAEVVALLAVPITGVVVKSVPGLAVVVSKTALEMRP